MPSKSTEFSEMVTFNAAPGTRALGAVAAKRAGYANLSMFLRDVLYALIEKQIPTDAERKMVLELLGGITPADADDDSAEDAAHNPQVRLLSPEAEQRIQDRIHARGGKTFRDSQKTGTDG